METPRYEVLSRTFIEPVLIEKGSIIDYAGPPGPHLYPLNDAAVAAFEAWYAEEHPQLDKDGEPIFYLDENGQRCQKMYKPHAAWRRQDYKPVEKERFQLVAAAPKPKPEELNHTLAGLGLKQATPDTRPPPDRIYRDAPVMAPDGGVIEEEPSAAPAVTIRKVGTIAKRDLQKELAAEGSMMAGMAKGAAQAGSE